MEELGAMWAYEESMDELKNRLLCTTLELESVKMEAIEEAKKYKDNVKHLLGLLKVAYQERDEARDHVHRLLDKLSPPNPTLNELGPGLGPVYSLGPQRDNYFVPSKPANSSLTESNNSHSPVDSFLDAVSSPDSTSLVFVNQRPNGQIQEFGPGPGLDPKIDSGSGIIDDLAKGKALPQKGKLLQTVMEAGPLLQTLLVAGPLPRWRNPPNLQPIRIPPVVSSCATAGILGQKMPLSSGPYSHNLGRANAQMCSASMLSFMGSSSSSSYPMMCSGPSGQIPMAKRQRFQ